MAQNDVQNFVPEHLEIKFRTINVYAEYICPVPGHPDSCHSKECPKMGLSNKSEVLLDCWYVRQEFIRTKRLMSADPTVMIRIVLVARLSVHVVKAYFLNLTLRRPCIVIYSYNERQRDALFLKFI